MDVFRESSSRSLTHRMAAIESSVWGGPDEEEAEAAPPTAERGGLAMFGGPCPVSSWCVCGGGGRGVCWSSVMVDLLIYQIIIIIIRWDSIVRDGWDQHGEGGDRQSACPPPPLMHGRPVPSIVEVIKLRFQQSINFKSEIERFLCGPCVSSLERRQK
jgi:hypothetical protein